MARTSHGIDAAAQQAATRPLTASTGTGRGNATDLRRFRVLSCVVVLVAVQGCGELCPDLCCLCVSRRK